MPLRAGEWSPVLARGGISTETSTHEAGHEDTGSSVTASPGLSVQWQQNTIYFSPILFSAPLSRSGGVTNRSIAHSARRRHRPLMCAATLASCAQIISNGWHSQSSGVSSVCSAVQAFVGCSTPEAFALLICATPPPSMCNLSSNCTLELEYNSSCT
jgi:hypothetical protein